MEQKDTFGNCHTKVLVSHVGYFERKVNEANLEKELRDKSGEPHAATCNKSCQIERALGLGSNRTQSNAVLPVTMWQLEVTKPLSHHQFLHIKDGDDDT